MHESSYELSRQVMKKKLLKIVRGIRRWGQRCQGANPPFYELQTPYFAWTFILTINYETKISQGAKKWPPLGPSYNYKYATKAKSTFAPAMSNSYLLIFKLKKIYLLN